jgi:hypothetical protein
MPLTKYDTDEVLPDKQVPPQEKLVEYKVLYGVRDTIQCLINQSLQ